jgi:hypothetical protein
VSLKRAEPRETAPGKDPDHDARSGADPSPPWKASMTKGGKESSSWAEEALKDEGGDDRCDEKGVPGKGPPRKGSVICMMSAWGQLEVARKRFAAQENTQERKTQKHPCENQKLKSFSFHDGSTINDSKERSNPQPPPETFTMKRFPDRVGFGQTVGSGMSRH